MSTHAPAPSTAPVAAPVAAQPGGLFSPTAAAAPAWLPGAGLPQDRHARIAARRCFVALKHRFMAAVAELDGQRADWLRFQVRQAQDPVDLWLLRGLVFEALDSEGPAAERTQAELSRVLDSVFPDSGELLPYGVRS